MSPSSIIQTVFKNAALQVRLRLAYGIGVILRLAYILHSPGFGLAPLENR